MTVAEFLDLPSVRTATPTVVSGAHLLHREVRSVSGDDDFPRGSQDDTVLVVLPGHRPPDDLTGIAALVLTDQAPGPHAGIPVISLADPSQAWRIVADGLEFIVRSGAQNDEELRRDEQRLLDVVIAGGDADAVLIALAELVDAPVAVTSLNRQLVSAANPPRLPRDPLDSWAAMASDPGFSVEVPDGSGASSRLLWIHESPVSSRARRLLARAAPLISLAPSVSPARDRGAKQRSDALRTLAALNGSARAASLLRRAGFVAERLAVPFAVRPDRELYLEADEWSDIAIALQDQWRRSADSLLVADSPDAGAWGVIAVRTGTDRANALAVLARTLGDVFESIQLLPPHLVAGQAVPLSEVPAELRAVVQAADAVADRAAWPTRDTWTDARAVELLRLAHVLRDDPAVRLFAERVLSALDGSSGQVLVDTLRVYCSTLGHKTETARLLHLNRQSLYTRLQRIEKIAHIDLDDPQTIVTFHLAFMLRDGPADTP